MGTVRPDISDDGNSGDSQSSSASWNLQSCGDHPDFNGDDLMSSVRSMFAMCRSMSKQMKRIEHRIRG